jgi:hypothetical protein
MRTATGGDTNLRVEKRMTGEGLETLLVITANWY